MSELSVLAAKEGGDQVSHHPTLYQTGRHGCWGFCVCGWESEVYPNVLSVHLAFGQHLISEVPYV